MTNKSFIYTAQRDARKSVTMSALDWQLFFEQGDKDGKLSEHAAYLAVAVVRRCLELRCNALSAIPAHVYQGADAPGPDDQTTPVEVPWEFAKYLPHILWLTEASAQLYGAAYWLREENYVKDKGYRWLLPKTIEPKYSPAKGLDHFERHVPGIETKNLRPIKDVLYYWTPCLNAEVGPGRGWVSTVLTDAETSKAQAEFTSAFFERGAIPAVLLSVEGNPPKEELDRLESWWKRLLQGAKHAWETVAVRATVEPKTIGLPLKDLAMAELSEVVRQRICEAAGVPQTLLDDAANFATASEHRQGFYAETIVPEATLIQAWLNEQVFNPQDLRIVLDWESLDIFQQDEAERAQALTQYTSAGVPLEIAMEILGIELPGEMTYEELAQRLEQQKEKDFQQQQQLMAMRQPPGQDEGRRRDEMRRWQRKALKGLAKGAANVEFDSDVLSDDECEAITTRLAAATTEEEVKAAFHGPFCAEGCAYP